MRQRYQISIKPYLCNILLTPGIPHLFYKCPVIQRLPNCGSKTNAAPTNPGVIINGSSKGTVIHYSSFALLKSVSTKAANYLVFLLACIYYSAFKNPLYCSPLCKVKLLFSSSFRCKALLPYREYF